MKTLNEIKEEYSKEQHYDGFETLLSKQESIENIKWHYDNLCKRYAIEVCKEALKNASENALLIRKNLVTGDELEVFFWTGSGKINFSVSRQSILSETNIPKEVKL